jgi:hypothetical protein
MSEPISPELVLVDPEIAQRVRSRPVERTRSGEVRQPAVGRGGDVAPPRGVLNGAPEPVPHEVGPQPSRPALHPVGRSWSRIALALLVISLTASGVLLALTLPAHDATRSSVIPAQAPRATTEKSGVPASKTARGASGGSVIRRDRRSGSTRTAHARRPASASTARARQSGARYRSASRKGARARLPRSNRRLETRASVERKLLTLLVQSPVGKLPPAMIDRRTGLAKNNLQASCKRSRAQSFLCLVRVAGQPSSKAMYVDYRPGATGKHRFAWHRYRRG